MTMTELQENLRNAQNELENARGAARTVYNNANATIDEINAAASAIQRAEARVNLIRDDIRNAQPSGGTPTPVNPTNTDPDRGEQLHDILASREYATSFADAIRHGVTPRNARGNDRYRVLLDAMTIGGGDPAGEDGGFLVPEDIDNTIHEIQRELHPLRDLFNVEQVTTNSGWRVMDSAPAAGMSSLDEMGTLSPGEQPTFTKVTYTLTKYGLLIPVSNELASDEVANLFGYLAKWFARKAVMTENTLLLTALGTLTATSLTAGKELDGIKAALNAALDPAVAMNATILTNQDGFNVLDSLKDGTGRPLLEPNPQTGTPMLFKNKPIVVVSNATLATDESDGAPIYIGDFRQFATLFERNPLEIKSTDIGGSAFRTDSIEVRGIKRMAVAKFDTAAAVARNITIA